jgi:predicted O-methyltransferase YrrM
MSGAPLVSCIMPTRDRRDFVPRAIAWFRRQDHPLKELVIVDDGDDAVADLVPTDGRIRYIRLDRRATVGRKRNLACEAAEGEIVMHCDDDDWYAADRISRQLAVLEESGADVCGADTIRFYDIVAARAWLYTYPADQPRWVAGATLAYRRSFWNEHRFDDIDVGEDAYFVWRAGPGRVAVVPDASFFLGTIHPANVSPKQTHGAYWQPCPLELVERQLGADLDVFARARVPRAPGATPARALAPASRTLRNVHACLVHERPDCVLDLVRNLRHCDPASEILLYDGSPGGRLLEDAAPLARLGAVIHPAPRPMRWGYLHEFAFDAMRFALGELGADMLTIVDSDQLAVRPGYAAYAGAFLAGRPRVGLLGTSAEIQPPSTQIGPAIQAWREIERWRPFLRKFPGGEQQFVRWTFWPSTVFGADAMRDLVALRDRNRDLHDLLDGSAMWAVEEVLFPTLVALLGHEVECNPCSPQLVRFRIPCTGAELGEAFEAESIYWIHPVTREYDDATRALVRRRLDGYSGAPPPAAEPAPGSFNGSRARAEPRAGILRALPILARMREVEGWLADDEADALIGLTAAAVGARPAARIVEVGSYQGRGTVVLASTAQALDASARVYAIDPHDGRLGALNQGLISVAPSADALARTIARYGLERTVVPIRAATAELHWNEPVDLLVIDGLHDYGSVARDFAAFAPLLQPGARVAFHDYAPYFHGVRAFVDGLVSQRAYRLLDIVGTLAVVEKVAGEGV